MKFVKYRVLHELRKQLEMGKTLSSSCTAIGIKGPNTIRAWRKKSSRVDRFVLACRMNSDKKRSDAVEDAFFKKLISGEGSAMDYIFFLTNRAGDRWKHQNALVQLDNSQHTHLTKITNTENKPRFVILPVAAKPMKAVQDAGNPV